MKWQVNIQFKRNENMATLLNDKEIKGLLGTVIVDGKEECVRPNSYILRLGSHGEFTNTSKIFELGRNQGIDLHPGHIVHVTSLETIDFSAQTIEKLYPGCNLHGFLSPTTDLSREGLTVASTQVDAGFHGTLNWTINNHSAISSRFCYAEKLFRLTIFRLHDDEKPQSLYQGDYQNKTGLVRSERKGPPVGMRDSDFINPLTEDSPENTIAVLIKSGYPWNLLGTELKKIDNQLATVSSEYATIKDSIEKLEVQVTNINTRLDKQPPPLTKQDVKEIITGEFKDSLAGQISDIITAQTKDMVTVTQLQDLVIKVLLGGIIGLGGMIGAVLLIFTDPNILINIDKYGPTAGLSLALTSLFLGLLLLFKK